MKKTSLIHVRVTEEERQVLGDLAAAEGRSMAGFIHRRLFAAEYQMEHLATDPAHRPVPQTLTVSAATVAPLDNATVSPYTENTATATNKPQSWMERNQSQTSRDSILRGISTKKGK